MHKDTTTYPDLPPQWWIWSDPSPKTVMQKRHQPMNPALLEDLRTLNTQLQNSLDNEDFKTAATVQTQMDAVRVELDKHPPRQVYRRKNSITHRLKDVLAYLHMTKKEWFAIHPDERLRLRIKTDIALKFDGTMRQN